MHRRIDEYLLDGSTASETDRITVTSVMFERNLRVTFDNFQPNFSILRGGGEGRNVVFKYFRMEQNLEFQVRGFRKFLTSPNFSILTIDSQICYLEGLEILKFHGTEDIFEILEILVIFIQSITIQFLL